METCRVLGSVRREARALSEIRSSRRIPQRLKSHRRRQDITAEVIDMEDDPYDPKTRKRYLLGMTDTSRIAGENAREETLRAVKASRFPQAVSAENTEPEGIRGVTFRSHLDLGALAEDVPAARRSRARGLPGTRHPGASPRARSPPTSGSKRTFGSSPSDRTGESPGTPVPRSRRDAPHQTGNDALRDTELQRRGSQRRIRLRRWDPHGRNRTACILLDPSVRNGSRFHPTSTSP